jgi:predicted acylesterase/phospholipase RssA
MGLFLAMKMDPDAIIDTLLSINPDRVTYSVKSLVTNCGLVSSDILKKTVLEMIGSNPTFEELDIDLRIPAFCLNYARTVTFSKHTDPTMKVIDAIVLSCTFPFLISISEYKGNTYIDGGFLEQWPADALLQHTRDECCLIRIDTTRINAELPFKINTLVDMIKAVYKSVMYIMRSNQDPPFRVVNIEIDGYNTIDFKMDYETKIKMIMKGTNYFLM